VCDTYLHTSTLKHLKHARVTKLMIDITSVPHTYIQMCDTYLHTKTLTCHVTREMWCGDVVCDVVCDVSIHDSPCVFSSKVCVCNMMRMRGTPQDGEDPQDDLKLQVIFCKRTTNNRALLRKMTYKDKASYMGLRHPVSVQR